MYLKQQLIRDDCPAPLDFQVVDTGIRETYVVIDPKKQTETYVITSSVYRARSAVTTEGDILRDNTEPLFKGSTAEARDFVAVYEPAGDVLMHDGVRGYKYWIDRSVHSAYCAEVGIPDDDGLRHLRYYVD